MIRRCSVCGKKLVIKLVDKKTVGGHYFGTIKLPVGKGEYKKTGHDKTLNVDVVKWTGKKKEMEYWECKKCFKED